MSSSTAADARALGPISKRVAWAAQIVSAAILGQTLFFKFSGAHEPVYIFQTLGVEPWGRLGTGVVELVAVVLLLMPRGAVFGALLAIGLMGGAIIAHLTRLGVAIVVDGQSDGGLLFALALTTLVCASLVAWLRRAEIPLVGTRLAHAR